MAKKKNDLFEILGARSKAVIDAVSGQTPSSGSDRGRSDGGRSDGGGRSGSKRGAGSTRAAAPKSGRSGKGHAVSSKSTVGGGSPGAATSVSGVMVAAVAFLCLLAGFGVGRWTADASDSNSEGLRVSTPRSGLEDRGVKPSSFDWAGPGDDSRRPAGAGQPLVAAEPLSDKKVLESLSPYVIALLPFPARDDTTAGALAAFEDSKRLVQWFRTQGFPDVRVRRMEHPKTRNDVWLVVDYLTQPQDFEEFDRFEGLEAPGFLPDLARHLRKRKFMSVTHPRSP